MNREDILQELLELAQREQCEIRRIALGGSGGGICRVRGKWVLFVDEMADPETQMESVAAALAEHLDLEAVYLRPEIRQILDSM